MQAKPDAGLLKGSGTQTDFWALPTEEAVQPQGLTLLPDPTRPLLINFPATHSAERTGGTPHGVEQSFLETLMTLKGEKEGSGEGRMSSFSPSKTASPHTENAAAGR